MTTYIKLQQAKHSDMCDDFIAAGYEKQLDCYVDVACNGDFVYATEQDLVGAVAETVTTAALIGDRLYTDDDVAVLRSATGVWLDEERVEDYFC